MLWPEFPPCSYEGKANHYEERGDYVCNQIRLDKNHDAEEECEEAAGEQRRPDERRWTHGSSITVICDTKKQGTREGALAEGHSDGGCDALMEIATTAQGSRGNRSVCGRGTAP